MYVDSETNRENPRDCSDTLIRSSLIESLLKSPRIKSACLVITK